MKNFLPSLLKLSAIDVKIAELVHDKTEIPISINQIKADINGLSREISQKEAEIEKFRSQKSQYEEFLEQKKQWLEAREPALKSLKTNRDYQLALKEMATAKKEITDKETLLSGVNTKLSELQQNYDETKLKNEPKIAELNTVIADQDVKLGQLDALITQENAVRAEIIALIDSQVIDIYNKTLSRGVPVLSVLEAGICRECSTRVPPQLANQVVTSKEIINCPRCKRILYTEDAAFSPN